MNVMAIEYPGYGLYNGNIDDDRILQDAEYVYDYLTIKLKVNPLDIIVFGRSIGSGPASWLASKRRIGVLVLMSAFTSIRAVVKDIAGVVAQYLVRERFCNIDCMPKVTSPVFLVHGLQDRLISYRHSQALKSK